jgi:hypothetical protein
MISQEALVEEARGQQLQDLNDVTKTVEKEEKKMKVSCLHRLAVLLGPLSQDHVCENYSTPHSNAQINIQAVLLEVIKALAADCINPLVPEFSFKF